MNDRSHPYAKKDLWNTLENALRAAGRDPSSLAPGDTAPLDHFHTGGLKASEELFGSAPVEDSEDILDVGAGIGGASRFLAERTSANITCLDLSSEFCAVNQRLVTATGLARRIRIVSGDATSLPFKNAAYDLAWMQQAAMNIEDKDALYSEIARVLRPGGKYIFQEIVAGPSPGPLLLPVPWASVQEDSHLEPADSMRSHLRAARLDEVHFEDVTANLLPGMVERVRAIEANGPPVLGVHLLSTADALAIIRGMLDSTELGRIRFVRGVYTAHS